MDCEPEINWANLRSSLQALIYHKSLETERNEAVGGGWANGKSRVQSQVGLGLKQSFREQIKFSNLAIHNCTEF